MPQPHPVQAWHEALAKRDPSRVPELLADDVVFHSPVVHTPQKGRAITTLYLQAAFEVLISSKFHYVREITSENTAILEFETELDGIHINGVDMIRYDAAGQIVDFKVMLRPLKAVNAVHALMGEMLTKLRE